MNGLGKIIVYWLGWGQASLYSHPEGEVTTATGVMPN